MVLVFTKKKFNYKGSTRTLFSHVFTWLVLGQLKGTYYHWGILILGLHATHGTEVQLGITFAIFSHFFMLPNQGWGAVKEISRDGQLGSDGETGSRLRRHGTVLPSGAISSKR